MSECSWALKNICFLDCTKWMMVASGMTVDDDFFKNLNDSDTDSCILTRSLQYNNLISSGRLW